MGLFKKSSNEDTKGSGIVENTNEDVPLPRTDNGFNIFERDNESLIWNPDSITYKIRKKEIMFELDGSLIIEFSNEKGLLGSREISFWSRRTDKFARKNTPEKWSICNSLYKKTASIMFSKKEADTYYNIFDQIISSLGDKIVAFSCTQQIKPLKIDEKNSLIKDDLNRFMRFSDIIDCEIIEDGETVVGGNAGKALVGGILLGPVGAIAGAVSKKKVTSTVNSVDLKILLSDINSSKRVYSLLKKPCKRNDADYRLAIGTAEQLYSTIYAITHTSAQTKQDTKQIQNDDSSFSAADEIMKYKQLLDIGVITQEEFNAKKKQLLEL